MAKARGSASSLPSEEEEEFRAIVEQVFRLLDVEKKGALDAVAIKYGLQLLGCEDKGRLKRVMRLIKAELKSTRTPSMQEEQFLQIARAELMSRNKGFEAERIFSLFCGDEDERMQDGGKRTTLKANDLRRVAEEVGLQDIPEEELAGMVQLLSDSDEVSVEDFKRTLNT